MMTDKKKLTVVHVITKLELGGAQVNTVYTYENLGESLFDAHLICGPGGILTGKVSRKENLTILDHLVRPINPVKDLKALFKLVKLFKKIKPDVVHTHSSKAGIIGRLAARLARVPAIVHSVHGFSFSPFQSFFKRTFFITAEKLVAKFTDHFIFVSNDDIEAAKKHKLIGPKTTGFSLIRSGFPFKKFTAAASDTAAVREKYDINETDFVCGIIAPFKPQKGLFHLVEIAARVLAAKKNNPAIIFMIAGDGSQRAALEAKINEKGISRNFRLPGFIFDIERAIDIFDIGVSTALWEGLPQSLVQLRLKKKAVVASDIPGNREVIKQNKNGFLVEVTDHKTFAERILYLVDNPAERQRMADFSGEDFSAWDADYMVQEQEKLYRSLINLAQRAK